MILVTTGSRDRRSRWINPDFIMEINSSPDTVISMINGNALTVKETPTEVSDRVIEYRAAILARAQQIQREAPRSSGAPDVYSAPKAGE